MIFRGIEDKVIDISIKVLKNLHTVQKTMELHSPKVSMKMEIFF